MSDEFDLFRDEGVVDHIKKCSACQRTGVKLRSSFWHSPYLICTECFIEWYDPSGADTIPTDPVSIGNYVRKKHGFAPLIASKPK